MNQPTKPKGKAGRPERVFNDTEKAMVQRAAVMRMPHEAIAKLLKTNQETLEKHFREVLDYASDQADMAVLGSLYKNAINGNVSAQIFWCKTRLGMKETNHLELTGKDGTPLRAIIQEGN